MAQSVEKKVSIIIPCLGEFPLVVFTVQNYINCLDRILRSGESLMDSYEILIGVNKSEIDETYQFFRKAKSYPQVKIFHPKKCNSYAVIKEGIERSTGEVVIWSDAHIMISFNSLQNFIIALFESPTTLHFGRLQLFGDPAIYYKYRLKLKKNFWGDLKYETDFTHLIPMFGSGLAGTSKECYKKFGGHFEHFKSGKGGGESYLCFKWWMFGGEVVSVFGTIYNHLPPKYIKRKYTHYQNDVNWNQMAAAYLISGDKWGKYMCSKFKFSEDIYDKMCNLCFFNRQFIKSCQNITFDELLILKPWNQKKLD